MKRLVYTTGEPAGIGIDLAILHALKKDKPQTYQLVTLADPRIIHDRAKELNLPISVNEISADDPFTPHQTRTIDIVPFNAPANVTTGQLNSRNARYVLDMLDHAIIGCERKNYHALVTGPIQKSMINDAGIDFSGHTEYLAKKTHTQQVVMMLATEGLRVALVTTHIPLAEVPNAITKELLCNTLRILNNDLQQKFTIKKPNILVCGLNPHAGENGHLGSEEQRIITPTLLQLQKEGINCQGPLPADTVFTQKYLDGADVVMAMYHDQGLPVLKYKGFGGAANITLGLPIIRTSVDHGTALDLAGTGNIDMGSLSTAIDYALTMNAVR